MFCAGRSGPGQHSLGCKRIRVVGRSWSGPGVCTRQPSPGALVGRSQARPERSGHSWDSENTPSPGLQGQLCSVRALFKTNKKSPSTTRVLRALTPQTGWSWPSLPAALHGGGPLEARLPQQGCLRNAPKEPRPGASDFLTSPHAAPEAVPC